MLRSIKLARTVKEGFTNFYRDKWLTVATVTVMTLTLFLIGTTIFLWVGVSQTIKVIQDRVNISIYFDFDVPEQEILAIKNRIEGEAPKEIESLHYISREDALEAFKKQEEGNPDIQSALDLIDANPLPAALVVVANDFDEYERIDTFFRQEYSEKILDTNLKRNSGTINDVKNRMLFLRNATLFLSAIFVVIAVLVTFNTVRMNIYAHRREFEVMRLVGASNRYVRIPVITEGILYALVSAIFAVGVLIFTVYIIDPFAQKALPDARIFEFYSESLASMVAGIFLIAIILGLFSSFIAIRRYLEK